MSAMLGALALAATPASHAVELYGNSTSLTYRGPSTSVPRPDRGRTMRIGPGQFRLPGAQTAAPQGELKLLAVATGQIVARARYDPQINGFFFVMPASFRLDTGPLCLALQGSDGRTLPLRGETADDDGYEFQHTSWEASLRSRGDAAGLAAEINRVQQRNDQDAREAAALQAALGITPGAAPAACQLGPAQAEPARPEWALTEDEALRLAQPACDAQLQERLRTRFAASPALQGMLDKAGVSAGSGQPGPAGSADGPAIRLSDDLATLIQMAIRRGPQDLAYADAVEGLRRLRQSCVRQQLQFAGAEWQKWTEARQAAANAPQIAKAQCEQRIQRLAQIQAGSVKSQAYLQALQARLQALQDPQQMTATQDLLGKRCKHR